MEIIARIHTDFPTKFGVPRQGGLVDALEARVIFEPPYRAPEALRGLEGFSHIWLIWQFSQALRAGWSATVRPPRLGGNVRMGVFATRSPYRPNPIGLSCVRLEGIDFGGADNILSTPASYGGGVSGWNSCLVKLEKWTGEDLVADVDRPINVVL